jgi:hypothetical protein
VGWLDEQPVTYGEVSRFLRTREPEAFFRNLEALVLERVTRSEASVLGIGVPEPMVRRQSAERVRQWEARVRAASKQQTGQEIDPALWLQRVAGMSMSEFLGHVRRHTEVELLQDRLLRYELLVASRVEVSILVVADEARARELAERLRGGGDFAALAREHSLHSSAAAGGEIPFPLLREDFNSPSVADAVLAAAPGEVVGPLLTGGGPAAGVWQIYRVEQRHAPLRGSAGELTERVERDLETRPVAVGEYERWRRRVLLRHGFHAAPPPKEEPTR